MEAQINDILWESIDIDPNKTNNCMTDLISHALAGVDWRELYDSWKEDRQQEIDYDDDDWPSEYWTWNKERGVWEGRTPTE